jgi:amidase
MTDDLCYHDAVELAALIRSREVSATEVLQAHLAQIERLNPLVNAVVSLDPDGALAAAAAADRATAAGLPLGPLHGLPISFKDTHRTAGMRTTFGSVRHADFVPESNDLHVQRIQAAGAIRIGKTNVPEYAAGSHTFNPVFGTTRNPYAPGRSAGGSSGGAAAALAAGFQPIADGSDMGGSLRNPASFCNVVGLRPTPGLVPNAEGSNVFTQLAVAGPMARTVSDVGLLLSVMSGRSAADPSSFEDPALLAPVEPLDLAGLRIAYAPTLGGRVTVDPEVLAVLDTQARFFEDLGARVEHGCPDLDGADQAFRTLRAAEFDAMFGQALRESPGDFNPFLSWNIAEGAKLTGREVFAAEQTVTRLVRAAAGFFADYDLVLAPVAQVPPFPAELQYPLEVDGEPQSSYLDWMRAAYLFTPLGIPAISVPGGFTPAGLPIGIQLLTARGTDATLLRIAKAYEQATGFGRITPDQKEAML